MKKIKANSAITLIALIITIIVLLILAGVTLNMVMGDNGIFGKANSAKEQTNKATLEETIKLAKLENRTAEASGEGALSNEELKSKIVDRLKDLGFFVSEDNNEVTYYEDKKIKLDDYLTDENTGEDKIKTTGITAADVQEHPDWYYGKKVTNYSSVNGQNDWRIFYSDGTYIFLITETYIDTREEGKLSSELGMATSKYSAYWSAAPSWVTVDSTILTRFKATEYTLQSDKESSRCVSTLLNSNNWKKYLDNEKGTGNAEYAIGSPTVEMWVASWNARYTDDSDQLYCNQTNDKGYYIGTESNPSTPCLYGYVMQAKTGWQNKLYFPNNASGDIITGAYWLASPSADYKQEILSVNKSGDVGYSGFDSSNLGLRPVVSLKSGITVNIENAE